MEDISARTQDPAAELESMHEADIPHEYVYLLVYVPSSASLGCSGCLAIHCSHGKCLQTQT